MSSTRKFELDITYHDGEGTDPDKVLTYALGAAEKAIRDAFSGCTIVGWFERSEEGELSTKIHVGISDNWRDVGSWKR